jgi:hypothetical protein
MAMLETEALGQSDEKYIGTNRKTALIGRFISTFAGIRRECLSCFKFIAKPRGYN